MWNLYTSCKRLESLIPGAFDCSLRGFPSTHLPHSFSTSLSKHQLHGQGPVVRVPRTLKGRGTCRKGKCCHGSAFGWKDPFLYFIFWHAARSFFNFLIFIFDKLWLQCMRIWRQSLRVFWNPIIAVRRNKPGTCHHQHNQSPLLLCSWPVLEIRKRWVLLGPHGIPFWYQFYCIENDTHVINFKVLKAVPPPCQGHTVAGLSSGISSARSQALWSSFPGTLIVQRASNTK